MSSFVNFLKSLFSGLFSFLGGLLGSKKSQAATGEASPKPRKSSKSGYFLELEDAKGIGRESSAPAKEPETAVAPSAAAASTSVAAPAALQSSDESAKPRAATPKAPDTTTPSSDHASVATALNLPKPAVTTFAPNYLLPAGRSNGRRRPGANMASFLDMARQVKTSS